MYCTCTFVVSSNRSFYTLPKLKDIFIDGMAAPSINETAHRNQIDLSLRWWDKRFLGFLMIGDGKTYCISSSHKGGDVRRCSAGRLVSVLEGIEFVMMDDL